ncbi:hypothetical protein ACFP6A_13485 [Quadrisphaera sp. GCM10027208]|uniref:hypothetical protein n=1 Tax=Quadrisphaera sp. GCM10027208 TaxID=3273423 RepID=UPI00360AADED
MSGPTQGWASPDGDAAGTGGPPQPGPAQPQPGPAQPQPGWGPPPAGPGYPQVPVAPRPGVVPLRPLRLGEIYDGAFQAVRSNPAAMVGAAAVVVTVMTAVQLVLQAWMGGSLGRFLSAVEEDPQAVPDTGLIADTLSTTGLAAVASQAVSVLALSVLTAIATVVVGSAVLGRRTGGSELWQRVRGRLLPLIGLTLLVGLVTGGVVLAVLVPGLVVVLVEPVVGTVLLLVGLLAALVLGLWIDTRLALAGPALVLEEQRVLASLRRSWRLSSRGLLRLVGIRVLTYLIVLVTVAVVAAPFQLVGSLFAPAGGDLAAALSPTLPQLLLTGLGSAVAATIVYPFAAAVTALLYVDQRMRLEGLDVELARAAAEAP